MDISSYKVGDKKGFLCDFIELIISILNSIHLICWDSGAGNFSSTIAVIFSNHSAAFSLGVSAILKFPMWFNIVIIE
jgi:hypothetical protein